jgi:hypothetical protein
MTSEGLGEVLKVTLQTHAPENFRLCRWGDGRTVKRVQTVSEDPHRRERNFPQVVQEISHKTDGQAFLNKSNVER